MQLRALIVAIALSVAASFKPYARMHCKCNVIHMGYVPDGLTEEQWEKEKEKLKPSSGLGKGGTAGMKFRSRSMEEFQKGRESGKLDYNMPMFNAKEKLRRGEIKETDIPYMQRAGGRPDNKDTSKKKFPWQRNKNG